MLIADEAAVNLQFRSTDQFGDNGIIGPVIARSDADGMMGIDTMTRDETNEIPPLSVAELSRAFTAYEPAIRRLQGARLFLTGGTGFFGKWIVSLLVFAAREAGIDIEVGVLTRNPANALAALPGVYGAGNVTLYPGDVRLFPAPAESFTHVIHAAADTTAEAAADPVLHFDSIVAGTRRVLDLAASHVCDGFLMVSSGAVYGPPKSRSGSAETDFGGRDPTDPREVYSEAKRAAEMQCALYAAKLGLPVKIARCFAFVGPYLPLDAHFAIGNFIRDALAGRDIVLNGDGTPLRSYLYAGDLAGWLLTILTEGRAGVAYNVGSGEALTLREVAERVRSALQAPGQVVVRGTPDPNGRQNIYLPDVERAKRELGLEARVGLEGAVAATAEWARRDRASAAR